jgi:sulfoxide reductase catalytic subunit YedY
MVLKTKKEVASSEITPKSVYEAYRSDRRRFLAGVGALGAAAVGAAAFPRWAHAAGGNLEKLQTTASKYTVDEATTPEAKAQSYNNFYEFGEQKDDPARNAGKMKIRPWTVKVEGLVKKPQTIDIDTILHYRPLESRVYRFRCVEAWSMVIPWDGYPFSEFVKAMDPLPSAKYVQFISKEDSGSMELPSGIEFPYSEGLRMDEAMHPLTLLTFGSYGEVLANQQGAPMRMVIPWKYGFKGAKSIVRIKFTDKQPSTTWNDMASSAYGFYSNVNPNVDTVPWSQARERLLNTNNIFAHEVPTQMFNGYSEVASLYSGMDLRKDY